MARGPRMPANSGYMHIITRGIGQQLLFEENQDYLYYLRLLEKYSEETNIKICAYCLMDNHVHLLIFDESYNVSVMMKKIGVSYSNYFNRKYYRTGHLFQDRYKSENIENERYLLTVFRYILRNPQKSGLCRASEYKWSSYALYNKKDSFVDTSVIGKMIGTREEYETFVNADNNDECMGHKKMVRDDEWAKRVVKAVLNIDSCTVLQQYPRRERDDAIRELRMHGLTIKQIARLTGINRGVVQRARL